MTAAPRAVIFSKWRQTDIVFFIMRAWTSSLNSRCCISSSAAFWLAENKQTKKLESSSSNWSLTCLQRSSSQSLGEIKVGGGRLYDGRSISNEAWKGVRPRHTSELWQAGPDKTRSHPLARLAPNSSGHTLTALPYTMLAHDPGLNHSDRQDYQLKLKLKCLLKFT